MENFGGEMRFRYDGQNQLTVRGEITINATNSTSESVTNMNGSVSKVVTLRPYAFEATFEDGDVDGNPIDWDAIVRATDVDATLVEEYTGKVHTWTGGHFPGDQSANRTNGEVSGLRFESSTYQRTNT